MKIKKNEYYKDEKGFIFKIKDIHHQEATASILIEINDWYNPFDFEGNKYNLNNNNSVIVVKHSYAATLNQLSQRQINEEELKAFKKTLEDAKKSKFSVFDVHLKLNPNRREFLKKLIEIETYKDDDETNTFTLPNYSKS